MRGAEILARVPGLEAVATIVRYHHERWDGAGYPDGLAGARIPLASRIIAVCDSYNAMTSDRPYRRAMSHADALAELHVNAGWQFDPVVVLGAIECSSRRWRHEPDVTYEVGTGSGPQAHVVTAPELDLRARPRRRSVPTGRMTWS